MLIFLSLFACEEEKTEPTEEEIPTVVATLHLLSAIDNSNQSEVPIHSELENEERLTEEDGKIPVLVEQSAIYNIHAGTPSTMNHIYQGWSGEEDFELVGYLVDTATTQSVYASLGLELETGKGIVVAALDYSDLSPVYGATAALSVSEQAFIFTQYRPEEGNTLVQGGSSFVFFPNVEPGQADISITPPQGVACKSYPGGQDWYDFTINVYADTVSVAVFQCDSM